MVVEGHMETRCCEMVDIRYSFLLSNNQHHKALTADTTFVALALQNDDLVNEKESCEFTHKQKPDL